MAMSKGAKIFLATAVIFFCLFIVGVIGFLVYLEVVKKQSVPENSVLVLTVSGELPDYVPEDEFAKALGIAQKESFTSLLTQLRKAKADQRISGVLLEINFPDIGWGRASELRDAIQDVRSSGKPVYAYMEFGTNKEYYIATAADKIFLPPSGDLWINGLAAEAMFFKGTLDKLGVEAEVIQIGPKYKNAPDQYTRKEMGEGQREVINAILDEYFDKYTAAISQARSKAPEDVKAIIDNAPYTATQAKELGLIDGALYREDVDEEFRKALGYAQDQKLKVIRSSKYRDISSDSIGLNKGERIAVIFASGTINSGKSNDGTWGDPSTGSDTVVKAVNDAAEDDSIKAIVLRVDSPGGSALASDLMWNALENAKAKKPVVVSMGDVAASGGYYISCNASKIVAQPTTITGSIGVFAGKPIVRGLYDWLGITNEYILRGKNAGIFRETEKWTPEERKKMEEQVGHIYYDNFLPKVARGRKMSTEQVDAIGQGRVWTGSQAKSNGLIDEFGGLERAIQIAKELANLPPDKDVKRVVFPAPRPFFESLFGGEDSSEIKSEQIKESLLKSLPPSAQKAFAFSSLMNSMERGDVMALMPIWLEIR
ncbi:MAG TPA: signal peptide peptidase SppA [Pyrinomonadaceae bacterium]|jgi:protease-4|nr:signal peptide peptidase SppA [Pyrinomonadaceae bacterium]